MKTLVVSIVLALVLAAAASGGGGRLVELAERIGALEAEHAEDEARDAELARRVDALELTTLRLRSRIACLEWKAAGRPPHKPNPCPRALPR